MNLKNAKQGKNKQEVLRILNKKKSRSGEEAQRRQTTPAPPAPEGDWGTPPPANRRPTTPPPNWSATETQDLEKMCRGQKKRPKNRGNEKKEKSQRGVGKQINKGGRRANKNISVKSLSNSRAGGAIKIPRQFILAQCRTEKLLTRIKDILDTIVKRIKKGQNDKKSSSLGKKKKMPKKGLSFVSPDGQYPRFSSEAVKKIESESFFNDSDVPWFASSVGKPVKSSVAASQTPECSISCQPSFAFEGSDKKYEEEAFSSLLHSPPI